ncbi:DUF92 domain-containing protein [Paenibacillus aurantius]|uniref:DUF92 domain-containing protein n=1 Tax=Paenibacillus aurantius TaxID=2918900 RepID=A0AA96RDT5_9BACL|nr:DUF92 domain-containing protein [Paenibacillus aurantius]WNQ09776.1 DUF92 domain-containing protein [Paenibacillus aurantius]
MNEAGDWLIGLAGSTLIGGLAYAKRSLSASGWAAAIVVGTLLYALGSPVWFGALLAFFLSSTLLSRWKKKAKSTAEEGYEKSGRRDAGQVAANGLPAALLCVAQAVWPDPAWLAAFLGVMASVNADTWATEVGGLSRRPPRSILTGRVVAPGTSGGITLLGSGAAAAGSLFIGAASFLLLLLYPDPAWAGQPSGLSAVLCFAAALAGGLVGAFSDSLIGAKWQRMYRCAVCGRTVEKTSHCGRPAVFARGWRWMNNDAVNIISSLLGGVAGAVIYRLLL